MLPDFIHVLAEVAKDNRVPTKRLTPEETRHLGSFFAALTSSLPTGTIAVMGVSMAMSGKEPRWVGWAEIGVILATLITAWQILRRVNQPYVIDAEAWQRDWHLGLQVGNADSALQVVAGKLTRSAVLLAGLGLIPPLTFICCPIAIVQASHALDLINSYELAIRARRGAQIARVLASFTLSLYGCALAFSLIMINPTRPTVPPPIILTP